MSSFDPLSLLLHVVGAFYALGGVLAARAALTSRFFDLAISAISAERPPRAETLLSVWLLVSAFLVLASGAALVILLDVAAWLFIASAASQALYLLVLAPLYFDRDDPPDPKGRNATTNAFVIYCAATALVMWAWQTGRLVAWQDADPALVAVAAAAVAIFAAWSTWMFLKPLGNSRSSSGSDADDLAPAWIDTGHKPAWESKAVKLMAEIETHPLWAMDEDTVGDFPPDALALSAELVRDIEAWNDAFQASFDPAEPDLSTWSAAEHAAHTEAGLALARRIAAERTDLTVWAVAPEGGLVEVHA